jgi:mono/diheme cytochrome c family protein
MMRGDRRRTRVSLGIGGAAILAGGVVLAGTGGKAEIAGAPLRVAQMGGMQHPMPGAGQGRTSPQTASTPAAPAAAEPHGGHGQAGDWKPAWPVGDVGRGREVFALLECYSCHEVKGEAFPAPAQAGKLGPELSQMGPLHSIEYFAEAIINPGGTIEKGKGYEAPDGSSKMPSYNDTITVQQLIDLVSYLRSLKPPTPGAAAPPAHGAGHGR